MAKCGLSTQINARNHQKIKNTVIVLRFENRQSLAILFHEMIYLQIRDREDFPWLGYQFGQSEVIIFTARSKQFFNWSRHEKP